jgi:hypothetical protein
MLRNTMPDRNLASVEAAALAAALLDSGRGTELVGA